MKNSNDDSPTELDQQQRQIAAVTVLVIVISFVVAIAAVRTSSAVVESYSTQSTPWIKSRMSGIFNYFSSDKKDEGYQLLFLGASDIQSGINPIGIDQNLQNQGFKTVSYNLGISNFDGKLLHLLSRRLNEIVQINKRPIDAIFVKFTPLRATYMYLAKVQDHYYRHFEDIESIIYSNKMLAEDFFKRPEEAAEVWYVKNILGETSPIAYASYFHEIIWQAIPVINTSASNIKTSNLTRQTWGSGVFNKPPGWNVEKRGFHYFGYPETEKLINELFADYQDPAVIRTFLKTHNYSGDLYNFYISPAAIRSYIQAIIELQKITPHVVLFYFPESSTIPHAPGANARIAKALAEIHNATGVQFMDLTNNSGLNPDDYFDQLHLNLQGQNKLAKKLAEEIPAILKMTKITK